MFKRTLALLVAGVGMMLALLACSSASQAAAVSTVANYAGTDNTQQTFDYWPTPGNDRPWAITLHGGAWVHSHAGDGPMTAVRTELNRLGVTVFDLNYRLGSESVHFADQKADIDNAFNYIRAHARYYHINPNRGLIYGHSAGGHLAAILGLEGNGGRGVRGIITTSGVLAPHWTVHPGTKPTQFNLNVYAYQTLMAGYPGPAWHSFLPQNYLSPNDPPILSFQGSIDPIIPPVEPLIFKYWAEKHGVQMTVVFDKGYGHTYLQLWHTPSSVEKFDAFVTSRLGCASTGC